MRNADRGARPVVEGAQLPGSSVREVALAEVKASDLPWFGDRLCWVFVLDYPHSIGSGPMGSPTRTPNYTIVVMDADSGNSLFGAQGGS